MDVRINFYKEGIFEYNTDYLKEKKSSPVNISIKPVIKLKPDNENFVFQMTIQLQSENTTILHYGFVMSMEIEGWIPVTSRDVQEYENNLNSGLASTLGSRAFGQLQKICGAAIGFSRGAIAAKTWQPDMPGLILPDIDLNRFVSTLSYSLIETK